MPENITPVSKIHAALTRLTRNSEKADRISQEIDDRQMALSLVDAEIDADTAFLMPLLAGLPRGAAVRFLDHAYWLDTGNIVGRSLRPTTDLLPDEDDGPAAKPPVLMPYVTLHPSAGNPPCDSCGNSTYISNGYYRCLKCGNAMTCEPAKPLSYGERQATQRYVPDPVILTDEQIDEAALRMAKLTEPLMSDEVVEAITDAWDGGDLEMVQTIVNAVAANGRVA